MLFLKSSFGKLIHKKEKPFSRCQRAEMVWLPRQDDFRTFCMRDETEKVYLELEEVISIC